MIVKLCKCCQMGGQKTIADGFGKSPQIAGEGQQQCKLRRRWDLFKRRRRQTCGDMIAERGSSSMPNPHLLGVRQRGVHLKGDAQPRGE